MNKSINNIKNTINQLMSKIDKKSIYIELIDKHLTNLLHKINDIENENEIENEMNKNNFSIPFAEPNIMVSHNADTSKKEIMQHNKIMELKSLIDVLNKTQQVEIFKLIYVSGKYTENSNGIFVNLTNINNEILWKIHDLVIYYSNKNKHLIEEQEQRNMIFDNMQTEQKKNINIITKDVSNDIIETEFNINTDLSDIENRILNEEFNIYNELLLSNKKPYYEGIEARIAKKCKDLNRNLESNNYIEE